MPGSRKRDPLVVPRDAFGVVALGLVHLIERGLPPSAWRSACRIAAWPVGLWRARRPSPKALASGRAEVTTVGLQTRLLAGELESLVLMGRLLRSPAWKPDVALDGRAHLDAALAKGRGAVLWIHRFQPFVHLVALAAAGFRPIRPSNPTHGHFSRSRFGARFLNRFQLRAEERCSERLVVPTGELAPVRQLARRLAANEIVSMYADLRGPRFVELAVGGGVVAVGVGPAALANHAGAALLPVFPLAEGRRGFRVVIEAPLAIAGTRAELEDGLRAHAPTFGRYLEAYAGQWHGWSSTPHGGVAVWRPRS